MGEGVVGAEPLAYVFWHWRQMEFDAAVYEDRQARFHRALREEPPDGFRGSASARVTGLPWAAGGGEAYEDWYVLDGFAALGALNSGAVSGSRRGPHDAVAAMVAGGSGGVYALRAGETLGSPAHAYWFSKPDGVAYGELFSEVLSLASASPGGALWMRQMVLGPGWEFCLHTAVAAELPPAIGARHVALSLVWPEATAVAR